MDYISEATYKDTRLPVRVPRGNEEDLIAPFRN